MIKVVFNDNEDYKRVSGLTQWDYGQELRIYGLQLSRAEVHFAAGGRSEAVIVLPTILEDGTIAARIPDKLLELGCEIKAYVYVADANSGETLRTMTLLVDKRPRPDDYDSPAEKNLLRQMLEQMEGKADNMQLVDGVLQLMSGSKAIGNKIRLPSSGGSGREIELRNNGAAIQWRYTDSNEWVDLITLDALRGAPGETPEFEIRDGHLFAIYKQ